MRFLLGVPVTMPSDAIPFWVSDHIPLHRIYRPTGAVMGNAGAAVIEGRLYIHPDRLAEMQRALANPQPAPTEFARWSDDGGRAP